MKRNFLLEHWALPVLNCKWNAGEVDEHLAAPLEEFLALRPGQLLSYRILNKSIDSRRGTPQLVYRLVLEIEGTVPVGKLQETDLTSQYPVVELDGKICSRLRNPLVIGAGPAGLFAAWKLAMCGCCPVVLERGQTVEERQKDIELFRSRRKFLEESNYLFGEGGAGTYSDGKLYTRIHDPRASLVLSVLIQAGAPQETGYLKRPHLGSDRLPGIIRNIRKEITALGGTFYFGSRVDRILQKNGTCIGVRLGSGEVLMAPAVILAPGLGGRKVVRELIQQGIRHELKPFQLGCRIEHPQDLVDRNQYRVKVRPKALGASEYNFVSRPAKDGTVSGVSTFCMCPGGEIICAAAESGQMSTNGMSNYARDGKFANSALIATLPAETFATARDAWAFLDDLEQKCFLAGGGDYTFPAQSAGGFLRGEAQLCRKENSTVFGIRPADISELLPSGHKAALQRAIRHFDTLMPGFVDAGQLIGIESYISSPVRLWRDPVSGMTEWKNLYCAGEGAGMAGGIISAAVDGLKCAEWAMQNSETV